MRPNLRSLVFVVLFTSTFSIPGFAQPWTVNSDQWTATDALERKLTDAAETGSTRKDKVIAMFYWTWHTDAHAAFTPTMNITNILAQYPEAATQADHPAWQGITPGVFWWDEPLFGYYRATDEWILRKHAEMLADAGVDVVFFDCTNGTYTWKSAYTVLLKVWDQARKDGVKTPQIGFMLPFAANSNSLVSMNQLYQELYKPELYKDLWFMWNGKPLIMSYPESLVAQNGGEAGLKFTASAPFYAVNATCPSWGNNTGNITFRLYKWNSTYLQSVSGTPIAEKTFINFNDNEKIRLTFDAQEAGEYIWVLSNGVDEVGVWKWTDSNNPVVSYYSGLPVSGNYESEISYNAQYNFTALTTGTNHVPISVTASIDAQAVNEMKNFFTFRPGQPDYVNGPSRDDQWGWNENYPQHGYAPKPDGSFEQATAGIAQNASDASGGHAAGFNSPLTYGRSYTKAAGQDNSPMAYLKGLNFQEQWGRAMEIDPDVVFITGWNEWIAGRWFDWDVKPFAFVDEYSAEKSRDIEPVKSWGDMGDVYYMQLISNVRKFKGMQSPDTASEAKTIDMENPATWSDVYPEFKSYKGNTLHRNHPAQGNTVVYTNTTGRNDIVSAKIARDQEFFYFNVQTAEILTDKSDPKWMRLFIDIDRDKSTGWEGYDFIVNRNSPEDSAIVERSDESWDWHSPAKIQYSLSGEMLVVKIPREVLGISNDQAINFEFKWSDNMQEDGNIMDFYVNGDAAPGARFNFIYKVEWADDGYRFPEVPEGTNQGLKCNEYNGVFDTIPAFVDQKLIKTNFLETFAIPAAGSEDFGLTYAGFIEVPTKDNYTFTLNADLAARIHIGRKLVVESENGMGEQTGTIKLMAGKHPIFVEYITKEANTGLLNIQIESSTLAKTSIPASMLFKFNQSPLVSLTFKKKQIYFSPIDSVILVNASDPDGSISRIEVYDNDLLIGEENSPEFAVKDFGIGDHILRVKAIDNDGAFVESIPLSFTVKPPIPIPGTIKTEDYSIGNSLVIINSTDSDGGLSIKVTYGWAEYPVNIAETGIYHFTFRVPASAGTKDVIIKANNHVVGTLDVGNTGTDMEWYDVGINLKLSSGIQVLRLDFPGRITVHKVNVSFLGSGIGIESKLQKTVLVMPNPSSSDFLIQTAQPSSSLVVYDLLGNIVEHSTLKQNAFSGRIGSGLRPGVYLLVVSGIDGSRQTVKIMKN